MLQALENGWVAQQIDSAFAHRAKDIASRKQGIIGVSEFPNLNELPLAHPPLDPQELKDDAVRRIKSVRNDRISSPNGTSPAAAVRAAEEGATLGHLADALGFHKEPTSIPPLKSHRLGEDFEELRDASDAWQTIHGQRPCVFLANMGPLSHYTARASYSKGFFEAGGFEVISGEGFQNADAAAEAFAAAFAGSGAAIAVICSSDKLYPKVVPEVATKLKSAGARTIVLAGKPGANEQAWRAAGVDRFIFASCNALATLQELQAEEGVLTI